MTVLGPGLAVAGAASCTDRSSSHAVGATDVGAHLGRGEQLDDRCKVPGPGLTQHEPLGPDRGGRPRDGPESWRAAYCASSEQEPLAGVDLGLRPEFCPNALS